MAPPLHWRTVNPNPPRFPSVSFAERAVAPRATLPPPPVPRLTNMQIVRLKAAGSSRQSAATFFPIPGDTLVLLQAGTLIPDEVGGVSVPDLSVGSVVKI